tara:strand:+ start:203 stop:3658 length:3456 start_codon:yes stop_codon:yes gene_type:complete
MAIYEYDEKGYRTDSFGSNTPKYKPAQEWGEFTDIQSRDKTFQERDFEITRDELDYYLKYRDKSLLKDTRKYSQQDFRSLVDNTKGNFKLKETINPESGKKTYKLYNKDSNGWSLYSSGNEESGLATLNPEFITDLKSKGKGSISQYSSWFDMTPTQRKEHGREEWMNTPFQMDLKVDKDGKTWSGWKKHGDKSPMQYTVGQEELTYLPNEIKEKYNLIGKNKLRMDPNDGEMYFVSDSGSIQKTISQPDMKWFQNPGRLKELSTDQRFDSKHDDVHDYLSNYDFKYHADSQPISLDPIELKEIPSDTPELELQKPSNIIPVDNEGEPDNIIEKIEEKDKAPQSTIEPEENEITSTEDVSNIEEDEIEINMPDITVTPEMEEKRDANIDSNLKDDDGEEFLNEPIEPGTGLEGDFNNDGEVDRWEQKKLKRQKMFQQDGGETDLLGNLKEVRGSTKYVNESVNAIIDSLSTDSYSESDLNKELNKFQKTYGDENLNVLKSLMELNGNPIARRGIELKKYQEAGETNPNWFKERLYNSVTPIGYDPNQALNEFLMGERQPFTWDGQPQTWETFGSNLGMSQEQADYIRNTSKDAWGMYLGMPQKYETFKESTSQPTEGEMSNDNYYSFNYDDDIWDHALIYNTFDENFKSENPNGKVIEDTGAGGFTLNNYTLDKGYDDDLDLPYVSYYDRFDFDIPIMGSTMPGEKIVGEPFGIYGRMYYDPSVKDENDRPARIFEEEFNKIGVDKNLLKAGIISEASYNGSNMMGEDLSSGLFGEDYSILEEKDLYDGNRNSFVNDIKTQNDLFDKKINGSLHEDEKGLEKVAKEIYYKYRNIIPYSQTEIAALVNQLGKDDTEKYIEDVKRDGFSIEEALPNRYGKDTTFERTPDMIINDFKEVEKNYNKSKSFEHYIVNTLPPNMSNKLLTGYSKEQLDQLNYNGELDGKANKRIKRINNEYERYLNGESISPTVEYELTKLGMINKGEVIDINKGKLEDQKKKYTKGRSKPTAQDVYEYIKMSNPKLTENQIVGIVANVEHESGFRPGVMGDSGTSGGLFQHHKSRLNKMKNFIGQDWNTDWRGQVDYAMTEDSMKKYLQKDYKNPTYATGAFMRIFERPKDQSDQNVLDRSQYLNKYDFDGDGKSIGRDDSYTSKV